MKRVSLIISMVTLFTVSIAIAKDDPYRVTVDVSHGKSEINNVGCAFQRVEKASTTLRLKLFSTRRKITKSEPIAPINLEAIWDNENKDPEKMICHGVDPSTRHWCMIKVTLKNKGDVGGDNGDPPPPPNNVKWVSVSDVDLDADTDNNSGDANRSPDHTDSEDELEYPGIYGEVIGILIGVNDDNDVSYDRRDYAEGLDGEHLMPEGDIYKYKLGIAALKAGTFNYSAGGVSSYSADGKTYPSKKSPFDRIHILRDNRYQDEVYIESSYGQKSGTTKTATADFRPDTPNAGWTIEDIVSHTFIQVDIDVDSDNSAGEKPIETEHFSTGGEDFFENHPADKLNRGSRANFKYGMVVPARLYDLNKDGHYDNGWNKNGGWDNPNAETVQGEADKKSLSPMIIRSLNTGGIKDLIESQFGYVGITIKKVSGSGAVRIFTKEENPANCSMVLSAIKDGDSQDRVGNKTLWDLLQTEDRQFLVEGLKPGMVELEVAMKVFKDENLITIHKDRVKISVISISLEINNTIDDEDDIIIKRKDEEARETPMNKPGQKRHYFPMKVRLNGPEGLSCKVKLADKPVNGGKGDVTIWHNGFKYSEKGETVTVGKALDTYITGESASQALNDVLIVASTDKTSDISCYENDLTVIWIYKKDVKFRGSKQQGKPLTTGSSAKYTNFADWRKNIVGLAIVHKPYGKKRDSVRNQMETTFTVTPNVKIPSVEWEIKQEKQRATWRILPDGEVKKSAKPVKGDKWEDDDFKHNLNQDVDQDDGITGLFGIDGPGADGLVYRPGNRYTYKGKFRQWVEVKIGKYWYVCSEYHHWRSIMHVKFKNDKEGWVKDDDKINEVVEGTIEGTPDSWGE